MVWFMYQPLNAVFHSFLNKFQRDWECLCESLRQANKQKCFLWVLLSNNAGFLGLPIQPALSLLPQDTNNTCILPAGPSRSLTCPQKSRLMPQRAQSYQSQVAVAGCGLLAGTCLSPQWGHQPHSLISSLLPIFPKAPHNSTQAVQPEGTTVTFRLTLQTWTSILFCSQIYRVDFNSNILLSLQAQSCVCQQ